MEKKLLIRLPNWVGDVVMTLPTLDFLQKSGIQLHLLGKPWAVDLLAAFGAPVTGLRHGFWQARKQVAGFHETDNMLLLTNSFSSALIARLAGKAAIGYQTDGRRWLLTKSMPKNEGLHEVQYFWELARFASHYWHENIVWPSALPDRMKLPISNKAVSRASSILQSNHITGPYWVFCPFAHGVGKNGAPKIWPHWRELSKRLRDYPVVVCPGKNEEQRCEQLAPEATVLSGLGLQDYAAVLAGATQVIANDSGPMHIATAVGANTLGIFGVSEPQRVRPWGGAYVGDLGRWPSVDDVLSSIKAGKMLE